MLKILFYIFSITLCANQLFGYDYFTSSLKDVTIEKAQILQINSNESPKEILQRYYKGEFTPLEGKSYGKGFSHDTFWILLKIKSNYKEHLYLSSNMQAIKELKLYTVQNNTIISSKEANYVPLYLELGKYQKDTFYLLEYKTKGPVFISFEINNGKYLDRYMNDQLYISIFLSGIAIALIIYNLFLFISTKNRLYLYYVLMSISFLAFNLFTRVGAIYLPEIFHLYSYYIVVVILYLSMVFLYLFTSLFFNLKERYIRYDKLLKNLIIFIFIINFIVLFFEKLHHITLVLFIIYLIIVTAIALKIYLDGFKNAKYFLIATGVHIVTTVAMPIVSFGNIEFILISYNLSFIGLTWDLLFLAFAIGLKIKDSEKNEELNKLLLIQSRQATFGTMIDTISHQWKQPLNELGLQMMYLDTKMRFENKVPSKEALEETILKSNNILEFMSKTIDIFRNFFKTSNDTTHVDISEVINNTILFLDSTFEVDNIKIEKDIEPRITIECLEEEFAHAILNILVNAKDIFKDRNIKDPIINISVKKEDHKIKIIIEDNAGGIKIKPIESIFQSNVSEKSHGGIGMYITHKIIEEKLGGKIEVMNIQDGARFTIIL